MAQVKVPHVMMTAEYHLHSRPVPPPPRHGGHHLQLQDLGPWEDVEARWLRLVSPGTVGTVSNCSLKLLSSFSLIDTIPPPPANTINTSSSILCIQHSNPANSSFVWTIQSFQQTTSNLYCLICFTQSIWSSPDSAHSTVPAGFDGEDHWDFRKISLDLWVLDIHVESNQPEWSVAESESKVNLVTVKQNMSRTVRLNSVGVIFQKFPS